MGPTRRAHLPFRTLLIEEDPLRLRFLERVLRSRGHEVCICPDAEQGWHTYQESGGYPLVVLGYPIAHALMLCRRMRERHSSHASVLVVVTWSPRREDLRAALLVGVDEYLARPLDLPRLEARLDTIERRVEGLVTRRQAEGTPRGAGDGSGGQVDQSPVPVRVPEQAAHDQPSARPEAQDAIEQTRHDLDARRREHEEEVRTLAAALERETASRREAETDLSAVRALLERRLDEHAAELRALTLALERESTARDAAERALAETAAEGDDRLDELRSTARALEQERARRERAETALESTESAASRAGRTLPADLRREVRLRANGILGMTDLVLDLELSAAQREYLRVVGVLARAILAAAESNESTAAHARVPGGEHASVVFSLRESLRDTLAPLAERARRKGVELSWHIAPDVADGLVGDPDLVRHLVVNLVGNAIQCTDQGEVTICIDSAFETPRHTVLLGTVADSGIGIPTGEQQQIFDALSGAEEAISRGDRHAALGLRVSSDLVRMMGGRIWFESEADQGTTFRFTLRLARRAAHGSPAALAASGAAHRRAASRTGAGFTRERATPLVLLLADDTPADREAVARLLEQRGHQVITVEDGREALAVLSTCAFDLVLTDLGMPRLDGFELAAAIRTRETGADAGQRLPIVALAHCEAPSDRRRCQAVGIDAHVATPVEAADLLRAIQRLCPP